MDIYAKYIVRYKHYAVLSYIPIFIRANIRYLLGMGEYMSQRIGNTIKVWDSQSRVFVCRRRRSIYKYSTKPPLNAKDNGHDDDNNDDDEDASRDFRVGAEEEGCLEMLLRI